MKRSARPGIVLTIATATLIATTGTAQAADPTAPATVIAAHIAAVAPDAEVAATIDGDDAFVGTAGETTTTIPLDATDPVTLTATNPAIPDVAITLPDLGGLDEARRAQDGTIVYTTDADAALAVQPLADGATRLISVLETPEAPTRYDYRFEDTRLELQDDGSVLIYTDDEITGAIAAPWATDAQGTPVPTHYQTNGDTLTQTVDHTTGDYTYPITADPTFGHTWGIPTMYLNWTETRNARDIAYAAFVCGLVAFPGNVLCGANMALVSKGAREAYSAGKCVKYLISPVSLMGQPYTCKK